MRWLGRWPLATGAPGIAEIRAGNLDDTACEEKLMHQGSILLETDLVDKEVTMSLCGDGHIYAVAGDAEVRKVVYAIVVCAQ
jgi:hypothetical protein